MATSSETVSRPESATGLDYDTIIIGAGISGLYQLYRLRQRGHKVRVFEAGTGVGGTWYWNRYPGCRFDSESYSYGYSFSQELLDEWDWTEHFASQPETERYLNHVADKFDLRRDIQLRSRVKAAVFDEAGTAWEITLEDGRRSPVALPRHRGGPAVRPDPATDRGRRGLRRRGLSHRALAQASRHVRRETGGRDRHRRDRRAGDPGDRQDRGASHRVPAPPNWCTPLHNRPIPKEEMDEIRKGYPELFKRCQETAACFVHTIDPRSTFEVREEERRAFWEKLYASPGFEIWMGNFRDMLIDRAANTLFSEFVAEQDPPASEGPGGRGEADPEGPRLRHAPRSAGDPLLRGLQSAERRAGQYPRHPDRADHTDRPQNHRPGVRVRHHRLRHRLRRHHRQLRPHRHPRARRAEAEGQVEGRALHIHGRDGRWLPEHVHGDGAAHRARQHSAQHRIQRRMDPRSARLHGRARSGQGTPGERPWTSGRGSSRKRARASSPTRSTPG